METPRLQAELVLWDESPCGIIFVDRDRWYSIVRGGASGSCASREAAISNVVDAVHFPQGPGLVIFEVPDHRPLLPPGFSTVACTAQEIIRAFLGACATLAIR